MQKEDDGRNDGDSHGGSARGVSGGEMEVRSCHVAAACRLVFEEDQTENLGEHAGFGWSWVLVLRNWAGRSAAAAVLYGDKRQGARRRENGGGRRDRREKEMGRRGNKEERIEGKRGWRKKGGGGCWQVCKIE